MSYNAIYDCATDRLSFRLVYQGSSKTLDGRVFVAKLGTPRWV